MHTSSIVLILFHGPPLSSFVCSPFYWAVLQFDRFFPAHILLLVITFVAENRIGEKKASPWIWNVFPLLLDIILLFFCSSFEHSQFSHLTMKKKIRKKFTRKCILQWMWYETERERERALLQLTYISDTKYNMLTKIHFVCLCAKFTFVHFKMTYTLIIPFRFCWRHTHTHNRSKYTNV